MNVEALIVMVILGVVELIVTWLNTRMSTPKLDTPKERIEILDKIVEIETDPLDQVEDSITELGEILAEARRVLNERYAQENKDDGQ